MADALLSPAVGGAFWAASAGLIGRSARKVARDDDESRVPLMGVMGAFVFAAQMINFTLPGTGSSGHLGGGLLLAVLLGSNRAFLTIASVLVVQCLFFADGGLLALGCNIFNMGVFPAFIAYPFIYRRIAGSAARGARLGAACIAAAVAALFMGAFMVVTQTVLSGVSSLPFDTFLLFMLPIHAAIGLVEGLVTWGVLAYIAQTQPDLLSRTVHAAPARRVAVSFAVAALVVGGLLSWYASGLPDGLEWSVDRTAGAHAPKPEPGGLHALLRAAQERIALLPDYGFGPTAAGQESAPPETTPGHTGTTASGLLGSALVVLLAGAAGMLLRSRNGKPGP